MASRFVATVAAAGIVLLGATGFAAVTSSQQAQTQQEDEFLKGAYVMETPGIRLPILKHEVHPRYTPDALRAKLHGEVELQVVVAPDGSVSRARVIKSLDKVFGLDDAAVAAAKQWTFEPGKLGGVPVPVVVNLNLQFKLH